MGFQCVVQMPSLTSWGSGKLKRIIPLDDMKVLAATDVGGAGDRTKKCCGGCEVCVD